MEYMESGSGNPPTFTTDDHYKWTDAYKEHTYPNGWTIENHIDPERPPKLNLLKQLMSYNHPTNDVENINSTKRGKKYKSLTCHELFPEEQKGCRKG